MSPILWFLFSYSGPPVSEHETWFYHRLFFVVFKARGLHLSEPIVIRCCPLSEYFGGTDDRGGTTAVRPLQRSHPLILLFYKGGGGIAYLQARLH